jgi:hypothetical protein
MSYDLAIIKFLKLKKTHKFIRHSLSAYYCRFQITVTGIYTARTTETEGTIESLMTASGTVAPLLGITYQLRGAFTKFSIDQIPPPPRPFMSKLTHSFLNSTPPCPFMPKLKSRAMAQSPKTACPSLLRPMPPSPLSLCPSSGLMLVFVPLGSWQSSSPRTPHQSIWPCWELDGDNAGDFI